MLLRQKFFASVLLRQRFVASLWSLSKPEWVLSGVPCCLRVNSLFVFVDFSGAVVASRVAGDPFRCSLALWKKQLQNMFGLSFDREFWVTHVTWMYPVNCSCKIVYASSFLLVDVYSILHTTVYSTHTLHSIVRCQMTFFSATGRIGGPGRWCHRTNGCTVCIWKYWCSV